METLERTLDREKTRESFKGVVWIYDFWGRFTERRATRKVIELAAIEDGKRILEMACGTGVVFEQIVRKNPNGENVGLDLSPAMLDKAKQRLQNFHGNFELKEGDALQIPFPDNTFDKVINNFMVDLMPVDVFDKVAGEFYRILKPGGVIVISTFSFGKKKINRFWLWLARHFPDLLTGCRPVSFGPHLTKAGFVIEEDIQISQNTFPSEVIRARKD